MTNSDFKSAKQAKKSWGDAIKAYLDKRVLSLLFLGFSAGLPYLLIFSSLSIWLKEAGFDIKVITMFSWAMLGYSFKFVWAPLIDAISLPVLSQKLGHRRSWLLMAQLLIIFAIFALGSIEPNNETALNYMAMLAVLLGFSSATQDIVIDAYRIEIADVSLQSALSAVYTAGYRIALITAGAGALFLADFFGSTTEAYSYQAWQKTYYIMASLMTIAVATTLLMKEPTQNVQRYQRSKTDYVHLFVLFLAGVSAFILAFSGISQILPDKIDSPLLKFVAECVKLLLSVAVSVLVGAGLVKSNIVNKQVATEVWIDPIRDFFIRYGKKAVLLLLLIGLYRISDIVAGTTSNLFYLDLGFSKTEIAWAVKTLGMWVAILGGFLGGLFAERFHIMKAMMIGAILASASNLLFFWLSMQGHSLPSLYTAVVLDNLASGLAQGVFIAFLSALTNIRFTAVQYAILSSLMTLIPKVLGGYSGGIVAQVGFGNFYVITAVMGLPVLWLIYLVEKKVMLKQPSENND